MVALDGGNKALVYGDVDAHVTAMNPLDGTVLWRSNVTVSEHSLLTGAVV